MNIRLSIWEVGILSKIKDGIGRVDWVEINPTLKKPLKYTHTHRLDNKGSIHRQEQGSSFLAIAVWHDN